MTIQRQYSLPNCKLVLEGWGDESESSKQAGFAETRPAMTILVNAECHFSGHEQSIQGDRAFLESLINSTSHYAQQVLSGVSHSGQQNGVMSPVQIQQVNSHIHRLIVRSPQSQDATTSAVTPESSTAQIDLSTVQLFDLVEALDQMVADAQTLPDLSPQLASVSKRGVKSQEPIAERVVPAAIGISSLAVAAIALFFIPPPEFRPTEQEPTANEQVIDGETNLDESESATEPDAATEAETDASEAATESDEAESDETESDETESVAATSADTSSEADSSTGDSTSGSSARDDSSSRSQPVTIDDLPREEEVEELFTQASPVNDRDEIRAIAQDLRDRLDEAWDNAPSFDEPLEYRVGVSEAGDIVGFSYRGDNRDMAIEFLNELPLMDLLVLPESPSTFEDQPLAQVRVVFRPNGVIEVSPWY